jgi:hypothetical protein
MKTLLNKLTCIIFLFMPNYWPWLQYCPSNYNKALDEFMIEQMKKWNFVHYNESVAKLGPLLIRVAGDIHGRMVPLSLESQQMRPSLLTIYKGMRKLRKECPSPRKIREKKQTNAFLDFLQEHKAGMVASFNVAFYSFLTRSDKFSEEHKLIDLLEEHGIPVWVEAGADVYNECNEILSKYTTVLTSPLMTRNEIALIWEAKGWPGGLKTMSFEILKKEPAPEDASTGSAPAANPNS